MGDAKELPKQAETMRNADDFQHPIYDEGGIPPLGTLETVKALLKMMDCKNLRDVNAAAKNWLDFDELLCGREDSRELEDHIVAASRKVYEECRAVYGADDEKTIGMMAETASLLENLERYEEAVALREDIMAVCQGKCGSTAWEATAHLAAMLEDMLRAGKIGETQKRIEIEIAALMETLNESGKEIDGVKAEVLDGIFNVYDALQAPFHSLELKGKKPRALRYKAGRDLQKVREQIAEICDRLLSQENTKLLNSVKRMPHVFKENGEWDSAIAMQKKIINLRQNTSGKDSDRKVLCDDLETLTNLFDWSGRRKEGIQARETLVALNRKTVNECQKAEQILEEKEQKRIAELVFAHDSSLLSEINDSLGSVRELHLICLRERIHNLDELAWNYQKVEDMDGFMKTKAELLETCRKWKDLATTAEETEETASWIEDTEIVLGLRGYEEEEDESHWPAGGDASCEGYIPCGIKHI